ncbi:RNA-directed DNA polymerase, eukaryota [Tanacetum coccineum]
MCDVCLFKKHKVLDGGKGFIAIFGECLNMGIYCLMLVAYAPQDASKKRSLWTRLHDLIQHFQTMTIMLGDFNEVRSESERLGCVFCKSGAKAFNEFIIESDLVDLPMGGPNAQFVSLPCHLSDHSPLLLKSHSSDYGPILLKNFNSWLFHCDFPTIVLQSWSNSSVSSTQHPHHPTQLLKIKLQNLKAHIRSWRIEVLNKNDNELNDLKAKMDLLEIKAKTGLTDIDIEERLSSLKKVEDLDHFNRLDLMINGIFSNGHWLTDPCLVTFEIYQFYSAKFRASQQNRPYFVSSLFKTLPDFESSLLDAPFTVQEIKNAVWDCGGSKAPGPDGFTFKFIKSNWDIIGEDFICMVDFEKAFDFLDWGFLDNIMDQIGFSGKWRMWIRGCLKSAYGLVLVNGSPTKEFKIEKGLRQGDPLLPFLFIIAVEALHVSLQKLRKWSIENASNLCRILRCFNLASGLKVNFSKSKFFGVGVDTNETHHLASIFNFQSSSLPCSYLGLPIGSNMNNAINWKPIIDKFHKRLTSWKAKTLSYGGRLTLLKSVLEALVCSPKSCGGLGIGSIHALNLATLSKWWWRFHLEKNSLWSLIITSIHGSHGRLTSDFPTISCRYTSPWLSISSLNKHLPQPHLNLANIFHKIVGDGGSTDFWLPTRHNLDAHGIDMHSTRCAICDEDIETTHHLFIDHTLASSIWSSVATCWGLSDFPTSVDLLIKWGDTINLNTLLDDIKVFSHS